MLGKRGSILLTVFLFAAILLTGRARVCLDDMVAEMRDDFEEMMYLPRGEGLKVIACGFDVPLADALFIKGMIYYAESIASKRKDERRAYVYELFDVITELSPRFYRAYQMGALLLTATASHKSSLDGVKLLEKGITNYSGMAKSGTPATPDARWLFHTLKANAYETNIQAHLRREGDLAGAVDARRKAAEEFRLAALSPGAPEYVAFAAAGIESVLAGKGGTENSLMAVLSVWKSLHAEAVARSDNDILSDLESRIEAIESQITAMRMTRDLESVLAKAGGEYVKRTGKAPASPQELMEEGLIPGLPRMPLETDEMRDEWLPLPDGSFKSRLLGEIDTNNHLDRLQNAVIDFNKTNRNPPSRPQELIDGGFIDAIPEPPFKQLGQFYRYSPKPGLFENVMPEEAKAE